MTWNPPLPKLEENKKCKHHEESTMSNQRILAHELDANISWSVIGLDLAKNDVSLVGITVDGEIIRVDRMSYVN